MNAFQCIGFMVNFLDKILKKKKKKKKVCVVTNKHGNRQLII